MKTKIFLASALFLVMALFINAQEVTSISPTSGPIGTKVTITGSGFLATGNIVFFQSITAPTFLMRITSSSSDGKTITFTVPSNLNPSCYYQTPQCGAPAIPTTDGQYDIYVDVNSFMAYGPPFTVTGSPTAVPTAAPSPAPYTLNVAYSGVSASGVTVTINPPGTAFSYPASVSYSSPTSVTITANNYTYADGSVYVFTSWQGALTGSANPATILVDGIKNVTAVYLHGDPTPPPTPSPNVEPTAVPSPTPPTYYLSVQLNGAANNLLSVTINPPGTTHAYPITNSYTSPTSVTVTANNYMNADGSGYVFMRWEGAFTGSTNPLTIMVDTQKILTAFYAVSDPIPTAVPTSVAPTPDPTPVVTCPVTIGDANGNGIVDIVDALVISQYYVGLTPAAIEVCGADVNRDGVINIVDALLVAQCYVGVRSCTF